MQSIVGRDPNLAKLILSFFSFRHRKREITLSFQFDTNYKPKSPEDEEDLNFL